MLMTPSSIRLLAEGVQASDQYTCPVCTWSLQEQERKRQHHAEAAAVLSLTPYVRMTMSSSRLLAGSGSIR